jgi:putative ABC transport system permease protein
LTIVSIALSVMLLVGVEQVRVAARESFTTAVSRTDLIVGPRMGALELLLFSVFHAGAPTNTIAYSSYERFRTHPAVAWTIPFSMGDSHYGFSVVGTTDDFYRHFRYHGDRRVEIAEGRQPTDLYDTAIGADVARERHYALGGRIVLAHGMSTGRGLLRHDDKPFRVVGILRRTGTPIDRSVYISLAGVEAVHLDWADGAPPLPGEELPVTTMKSEELKITQITGFFLQAKSRIDTLRLQRDINTFANEPLMSVIPGVALAELWQTVGYIETGLAVISVVVLLVGLLGMLVSVYTSLNERRREMAILRAVGAGPTRIALLFVVESSLVSLTGAALGLALVYAAILAGQPLVEQQFGLFLPVLPPTPKTYAELAAVCVLGSAIAVVPAVKAYRSALSDGLGVRL